MRTFLTDYPDLNKCRFYDEYSGIFCSSPVYENSAYCPFHLNKIGDNNIENVSSKYFYFDAVNYYKLDEKSADELVNGAWEVLAHYDEYKKSFKILDLPENSEIETIKKRYKYLAKTFHPDVMENKDINFKTEKKFYEINNAYRFLIKMLSKNKLL